MQNQKVVGVLIGGIIVGAALGAGVTMNMKKRTAGNGGISAATCSVDGAMDESALFEYEGKYAR